MELACTSDSGYWERHLQRYCAALRPTTTYVFFGLRTVVHIYFASASTFRAELTNVGIRHVQLFPIREHMRKRSASQVLGHSSNLTAENRTDRGTRMSATTKAAS